jgi:hypothetical protein
MGGLDMICGDELCELRSDETSYVMISCAICGQMNDRPTTEEQACQHMLGRSRLHISASLLLPVRWLLR